jgi:hypothetical protein
VPVTTALAVGGDGKVTALWEDPRPDPGTTSIWSASAISDVMEFDVPRRVDADAFTSRPQRLPSDPTVASDGDRHVLTLFVAATRSEQNDLYAAASSVGGRTFSAPTLVSHDPAGTRNHQAPAAALGPEGVGWVLAASAGSTGFSSGVRLFRTADFGASFPETAMDLGGSIGLLHVAAAEGGIGLAAWLSGSGARLARGGGPGTPVTQTLLSANAYDAAVCADGPTRDRALHGWSVSRGQAEQRRWSDLRPRPLPEYLR